MDSDISASVIRWLQDFLLSNLYVFVTCLHFTRRKWQTIHYMTIGNSLMSEGYVTTDTTSGVRYELMIIIIIIIIVIIIIFSRSSSREKVPEEMIILFIHSLFSLHFAVLFCSGNRSWVTHHLRLISFSAKFLFSFPSFHKTRAMTFHVLSSAYGENLYRDWETLDEER